MKVIVIGGGPAGMLAAISAKKQGNEVTLIEKNNRLGRKMEITGKGRCNITSSKNMSEFIENVPGNGKFLYSAFQNFTNKDIINLINIPVKEERGNRIFPCSDKARDVIDAIEKNLKGIEIIKNTNVNKILIVKKEDRKYVVGVATSEKEYKADKVIIATGGKSYPLTGSNGDGYKMAEELGHTITEIKPSLIPMIAEKDSLNVCKELQGLSLKNVSIKVYESGKIRYEDFGELLFTHFGISGPIVLSASAHLVRTRMQDVKVEIDLKPALDEEKLDARLLRDFEKNKNKEFKNSLNELLPQKMIPVIVELSGIYSDKKVNEITKKERHQLVKQLKRLEIKISGFRPIDEAIITSGGIKTSEINPKTMESKLVTGLFFAGEIIDVDAYTGGFNLQIAYSTGYTAGLN